MRVLSFANDHATYHPPANIVIMDSKPTIDVQTIIPKAEQALNGLCIPHTVGLEYLVRPNGSLSLVHAVQIRNDELGTWYEAFVDAHFGDILSVTDFVCQVSASKSYELRTQLTEDNSTQCSPSQNRHPKKNPMMGSRY